MITIITVSTTSAVAAIADAIITTTVLRPFFPGPPG